MKIASLLGLGLGLISATAIAATPAAQSTEQSGTMSNFTQGSDVVTLPDGLKYKIIKAGTGEKPKLDSTVIVNYEGTLVDGTKFDSSYDRNEPAQFQVSQVIPGWIEALQLMPVGSVWQIYIPASLAYGEAGVPPIIGPNQPLIFKVELIGIKK